MSNFRKIVNKNDRKMLFIGFPDNYAITALRFTRPVSQTQNGSEKRRVSQVNIDLYRVIVKIVKIGFREIDYEIQFPKAIDCDVLIVHTLHQGIYISNDQLNDLKRLKLVREFLCNQHSSLSPHSFQLESYVPSHINIELPMERASPFTIYLFGSAKSQINLRLPIHLRYQSPGKKK